MSKKNEEFIKNENDNFEKSLKFEFILLLLL